MAADTIATCTDCVAGKWSKTVAADTIATCKSCGGGKYANAAATSCTDCTGGKYSTASGATSIATCKSCDVGEYSMCQCIDFDDDCASNPCQNGGTCTERLTDGVNSYSCACAAGYSGNNCEKDIDDCAYHRCITEGMCPCKNGGTCTDGVNSYSCGCINGFTGDNCNECGPGKGKNADTGRCEDCTYHFGVYNAWYLNYNSNITHDAACAQKDCPLGRGVTSDSATWTETGNCEFCGIGYESAAGVGQCTDIDDCASSPCKNEGTCTDGVNSYSCACVAGYSGNNCATNVDDCASSPCENGGTCTDGVNSYSCVCVAGYSGNNCEKNTTDCCGATACSKCAAGKWSDTRHAFLESTCKDCPAGKKSSVNGTRDWTSAEDREVLVANGQAGVGYEPYLGTQSKTISNTDCIQWAQAPLYSNHPDTKSNYCRNPDGSSTIWCYTDQQTREDCLAAPATNVPATDVCTNCPEGKYSDAGSTVCTYCPAGFVGIFAGTSKCIPCASGLYQDEQTGQSHCKLCLKGKYSNARSGPRQMLWRSESDTRYKFLTSGKCTDEPGWESLSPGGECNNASRILGATKKVNVPGRSAQCLNCYDNTYKNLDTRESCEYGWCSFRPWKYNTRAKCEAAKCVDDGYWHDTDDPTSFGYQHPSSNVGHITPGSENDITGYVEPGSCTGTEDYGKDYGTLCYKYCEWWPKSAHEWREANKDYWTTGVWQEKDLTILPPKNSGWCHNPDKSNNCDNICVLNDEITAVSDWNTKKNSRTNYWFNNALWLPVWSPFRHVSDTSWYWGYQSIAFVNKDWSEGSGLNTDCTSCDVGYYNDDIASHACKACPRGKMSLYSDEISCSFGRCAASGPHSPTSASMCGKCPVGKSSMKYDAGDDIYYSAFNECLDCPEGTYQDEEGGIHCKWCPLGTWSDKRNQTSTESCFNCHAGTYDNRSRQKTSLVRLDTGERVTAYNPNSIKSTDCTDSCPRGYYSAIGEGVCTSCPKGKAHVGFAKFDSIDECLVCEGGQYSIGGDCIDCPMGYYSAGEVDSCTSCPKGTYADAIKTVTCKNCPVNTQSVTRGRSTACEDCPNGIFSTGGPVADDAAECRECFQGRYTDSGECKGCVAGQYNDRPDKSYTSCLHCPTGKYSTVTKSEVSSDCQDCPTGKWSETTGANVCQDCSAGKYSSASGSNSSSTCQDCSAGKYSAASGANSCQTCPAGQMSVTGATECENCAAGKWSATSGVGVCQDCPTGQFSPNTGAVSVVSCLDCPAGKYFETASSGASSADICQDCPEGKYNPSQPGKPCSNCENGRYTDIEGSSSCDICSAGKYSKSGWVAHCYTDKGRTQAQCALAASTWDIKCVDNSGRTQAQCALAASIWIPACRNCPIGQYNHRSGRSKCRTCPNGKYSTAEGSTQCQTCTGTSVPNSIQTTCIECQAGKRLVGKSCVELNSCKLVKHWYDNSQCLCN